MNTNSIILQNLSTEQLTDLIGKVFDAKFKGLQKIESKQVENDNLMIRSEVLELLQINPSTLYLWTKKGKITVYKVLNKCYYKRSEVMAGLIKPLNK
jgi:hypothetical protein